MSVDQVSDFAPRGFVAIPAGPALHFENNPPEYVGCGLVAPDQHIQNRRVFLDLEFFGR